MTSPFQSSARGTLTDHVSRIRRLERHRKKHFLPVVFDGQGSVLTPGVKGDVSAHFNCTITGWRLLADEVGDLVVDVWKTDYASFPPTVANTITAADQPTLPGTDKADDTALTGWDTQVYDGDTFRFNIDSVSGITRATLILSLIAY